VLYEFADSHLASLIDHKKALVSSIKSNSALALHHESDITHAIPSPLVSQIV